MSFLSKSSLFHRILNRKYNFFVKFFFAVIVFSVCLIFSLNLQLSIFISREIIFGDDLKNDIRKLIWIIKTSIFPISYSIDLMFDFCSGLENKYLDFYKKRLNFYLKFKNNVFAELDLLKLIAYEIENLKNNDLSKKSILLREFKSQYFQIKRRLKSNKEESNNLIKRNKKKIFYKSRGMNIHDAKEVLLDLDHFFSTCNITWFVIAGTFLGFIRENSFLKHDLDIDIGINENSISVEEFKKYIENFKKFRIARIEYQRVYINSQENILRPVLFRLVHVNGINVDVFFHFLIKNKIYHGTSSIIWKNKIFSLSPIYIYGLNINGPKESNEYLKETYGNWKLKKKDYIYHRDMPSISGAYNHLGLEYLLRCQFFLGIDKISEISYLESLLFS